MSQVHDQVPSDCGSPPTVGGVIGGRSDDAGSGGEATALPLSRGRGDAVTVALESGSTVAGGGRREGAAEGVGRNPCGTMTGVGVGVGVGEGAGEVIRVASGVGALGREAGTSGATGPCKSGGGCCVPEAGGSRKSVSEAPAGAATARARTGARIVERIGYVSRLGAAG